MKSLTQALYKIRLFLAIVYAAEDQCPARLCVMRIFQCLSFEARVCYSETLITFKILILS